MQLLTTTTTTKKNQRKHSMGGGGGGELKVQCINACKDYKTFTAICDSYYTVHVEIFLDKLELVGFVLTQIRQAVTGNMQFKLLSNTCMK